ncbi:hypothetical protein C2845_PM06G05260 [Panicum miliaceum]|uniref:Uncharacterized protein n=1 Tax=Panicum miliaceum TaxID=4540 RepID=A0A3L6R7S8_PANMI|nr:hypothetical protein C2845_PM06G05260 [Panicum miliaceum]
MDLFAAKAAVTKGKAPSGLLRRSRPAGRLETKKPKPTPSATSCRFRAASSIDRSAVSSPADSPEEDSAGRRRLRLVRKHTGTATGIRRGWRDHAADLGAGRGALDSRFRPRNWVVLAISPDAGPRRRLLNMATAASLSVDLPALTTHCHLCAVDGLLVLFHTIHPPPGPSQQRRHRVPPISTSSIVATVPTRSHYFDMFFPGGIDGYSINGAAYESTSPPTLVLCLRGNLHQLIFAKPGDAHWTLEPRLALEGSVFLLDLGAPFSASVSYLVAGGDGGEDADGTVFG